MMMQVQRFVHLVRSSGGNIRFRCVHACMCSCMRACPCAGARLPAHVALCSPPRMVVPKGAHGIPRCCITLYTLYTHLQAPTCFFAICWANGRRLAHTCLHMDATACSPTSQAAPTCSIWRVPVPSLQVCCAAAGRGTACCRVRVSPCARHCHCSGRGAGAMQLE